MRLFLNASICVAAACLFVGCEAKEKVLDVETPGGGVEILKSDDGVEIDIDGDNKSGDSIEIDVPKDTN